MRIFIRLLTLFFVLLAGARSAAQSGDSVNELEMSKPSSHTIAVNGIQLHYQKSGKGEPLLLLHGWTQTSAFWKPYITLFEKDYEVYAIDLRGHGRSTPLSTDFSIQKASQDIREMIHQLGLQRVKAIGLSFGGLILLELAATDPDLLDKIVVIGTSYQYDGKEARKGKPSFSYDDLDASFKSVLREQHSSEEQIRALFNPELNYRIFLQEDQLTTMKTEVFIIHGESDEIADPRQAQRMSELIPHSMLWTISGAGHLAINENNQEEFVRKLKAFFLK
jgi:pimeloyl-ACP methyl ester carboxylesterase